MSDIAIRVEGLGKRYRIGKRQASYGTLRDSLAETFAAPFKRFRRNDNGASPPALCPLPPDTIWALKDVSFDVKRGEVVGIIGRNGAGKSTLLKVLSRITEPTAGAVDIYGRVGSLLEVGTGFHPELSGRENIYLNSAILGITQKEIDRKLDAIVDFAEVEKFLDTPVKRYSSGMYLRLAFAVAAHLDSEILLIDEVLAVGDASFQKKCLGKMDAAAKDGRTVLFVSHNMVAVQSLCARAIWLDAGQVVGDGGKDSIISSYFKSGSGSEDNTDHFWQTPSLAPGNEHVRLHKLSVNPQTSSPLDPISMQTGFDIEIEYWNLVPDARLNVTLHIVNDQGIVAFTTGNGREETWRGRPMPQGKFRTVCHVPGNLLNSGHHRVTLLFVKDLSTVIFSKPEILAVDVVDAESRGEGWQGKEPGIVQPQLQWNTVLLNSSVS